ncbi:hypothetical protein E8E14_011448 [Neopestalotiopsis sp. 37M]|nr:hypothetical protein E8E14_011448 [Neopestalotiopsis sp. 37M]
MAEIDMVLKWQQSVRDDHHIDEKPPVSHLFTVCSEFYAEIVAQLSANSATERGLLLKLQRSHSYLILWADGYGVTEGHLDASLDKSRRVKRSTINLLISICQTLTKRLLPTLGREQQLRLQDRAAEVMHKVELLKLIGSQDEPVDSDDDSDTESESSQSSDTAAELDDIAEDLKTDTECLLDLGSRFKEQAVGPVVIETAVDPDELIIWDPSDTFIDRVRWRYPKCDPEVSQRLGRANWTRVLRQQTLKDMNGRKVEPRPHDLVEPCETPRFVPESVKSKETAQSEATATTFRDSALGSSIPSESSQPPAPEYAETTVSYNGGQGDTVRIPALPPGARDGKAFLCVGCNKMVTTPTKSLWKKHLFSDLKPYLCLVSTCGLNEKPFATKSEWKDHMDLKHSSDQNLKRNCPVCQENEFFGDEHFRSHLAKHLEEVALTILPTNADSEDGTDADSGLASPESSHSTEIEAMEAARKSDKKSENEIIRAKVLEPLLTWRLFRNFTPSIYRIAELLRPGSKLRRVEDALLHVAMETSTYAELYRECSLEILEHISRCSAELDLSTQSEPGERPYDEQYFADAKEGILQRARDMERMEPLAEDSSMETRMAKEEALDNAIKDIMSWRAQDTIVPHTSVCQEPDCGKEFKRPCDLSKHQKTHSRPWKCPIPTCKYREYGWPTEKELDRHWADKHEETPTTMYACLFTPCPYKSKRESNCKQHMEKAHGWTYVRSKTNGKKSVVHNEDIPISDGITDLPTISNIMDLNHPKPSGIEAEIGSVYPPGLIPPPISSASRASIPDLGLDAAIKTSDEDWTKITDLAERRRIQNRIAQRNYRKKLKERLENLEKGTTISDDPLPESGSVNSPRVATQLMVPTDGIHGNNQEEKGKEPHISNINFFLNDESAPPGSERLQVPFAAVSDLHGEGGPRIPEATRWSQRCMNFIGSGVVFHVPSFFKELKELEEKGLPSVHDRILVSDRVQIDLDMHVAVDGLEEEELGAKSVGTTRRGIGPAYSTKAARSGIRLSEVFNAELFESKLRRLADGYRKRYGDLFKYDVEDELKRFEEYRPKLAKYAVDGVSFMRSAQENGTNIIVEGANFSPPERGAEAKRWCLSTWEQALMLDIEYGSYPYVTSSNTTLAGIIGGLTLNPKNITETVGVVKAYTTRVGHGAFKTEDLGEIGTKLQEIGREWGTSTGRRRRCGCGLFKVTDSYRPDLVVVKYSTSINYYSALNLTKLDVLDTFETIKIATAYKVDGQELDSYPADLDILDRAEVVYHEMPGWQKPTTNAKSYYDLPKQAREYIEFIENFVGVKIKWIGTGPDREAMIKRS